MSESSEPSNPLIILLDFILLALIFLIGAYLSTFLLSNLPIHQFVWFKSLQLVYGAVFNFFDASFIFLIIFAMILDIAMSWVNPKFIRGIANILFVLVFAYSTVVVNVTVTAANNALAFSTLLPNTYSFFNNHYYIILIFMSLIISTIFNFRSIHTRSTNSYTNNVYGYGEDAY